MRIYDIALICEQSDQYRKKLTEISDWLRGSENEALTNMPFL